MSQTNFLDILKNGISDIHREVQSRCFVSGIAYIYIYIYIYIYKMITANQTPRNVSQDKFPGSAVTNKNRLHEYTKEQLEFRKGLLPFRCESFLNVSYANA